MLNTNLFKAYVEPVPRPTSKILPSKVQASINEPLPWLRIVAATRTDFQVIILYKDC